MQYLILGMHRSGTSMLSRLMNLMGASVGPADGMGRPAEDNESGFWERWEVAHLNNRILGAAGGSWDEVSDIDLARISGLELDQIDAGIAEIIFRMDVARPWVLKDPRFCFTAPRWAAQLESPFYLFCIRDPLHVARSLNRRNGITLELGLAIWERYNLEALGFLNGPALHRPVLLIDYSTLLQAPAETVARLHEQLQVRGATGLRLPDRSEVEAFVSSTLDHSSRSVASIDGSGVVADLANGHYAQLRRCHLSGVPLAPWSLDRRIIDVLQRQRRFVSARRAAEQAERPSVPDLRSSSQLLQGVQANLEATTLGVSRVELELGATRALQDESRAMLRSVSDGLERLRSELQALAAVAQGSATSTGALESSVVAIGRQSAVAYAQASEGLRLARDEFGKLKGALRERDEELIDRAVRQSRSAVEASLRDQARDRDQQLETERRLEQAQEWLDEMSRLHAALLGSVRWRLGDGICSVFEMAGLRPRGSVAARDIVRIDAQVRAWRGLPALPADNATATPRQRAPRSERVSRAGRASSWSALRARASTAAGSTVTAAKRAVHASISAMPISAQRKESIRRRIFELQESILLRAPSEAMLEDARSLAEGRYAAMRPTEGGSNEPVRVDVSLVLFNSERHLAGFVSALGASDYPLDQIALLVTDHSPGGGCAAAFEREIAPIRHRLAGVQISARANKGFGAGHNYNLGHASADVFFVCNVDGALAANCISELVRAFVRSDPAFVAWEARQVPYEHPKYYDPVTLETSWVSGACVLLRTDVLRACGGFERRIFMYGEDVELSYRLRSRGGKLGYVPTAVMRHDTYSEANEFKPLQFHGSTLANMYLRLRYGKASDIASIPAMWLRLASIATAQGELSGYLRQTLRLLCNAPYFLRTRAPATVRLPFAGWDYGLRRDGAFVPVEPVFATADTPLVSIVTRTCGERQELLRQALRCIANQTYRRVEVIVAEDGGDRAASVCAEVAAATGLTIRHLPLAKGGRCAAGNAGLAATRGEFVGFLDDDDLLFADHVEQLLATLLRDPTVAGAYALAWESPVREDPQGRQLEIMHRTIAAHRRPFDRDVLSHHNLMSIQAVLFRRSLYERYGGFDEQLEILEDWDLWRRYSFQNDFQLVPKTTSIYHIPAEQSVQAGRQLQLDAYYERAKTRFEEFRRNQQSTSDGPVGPSAR